MARYEIGQSVSKRIKAREVTKYQVGAMLPLVQSATKSVVGQWQIIAVEHNDDGSFLLKGVVRKLAG